MYKREKEAKVTDPLEDLLSLAVETKSKMGKVRAVTGFGALGGVLGGIVLLELGILRMVFTIVDSLSVIAIVAGIFSLVVSILSFSLQRFFDYFERRIDTIDRFVRYNPRPPIPMANSPVDRILRWLEGEDTKFQRLRGRHPKSLRFKTSPPGMDSSYNLDAYFGRKSWLIPFEYHLFVKVFDRGVTVTDLEEFKANVENTLRKVKVAPSRTMLIQTIPEDLSEEVVSWVDENWILYPIGKKPGKEDQAVPIEIFVESEDGHYDLATVYVS